MLTMPELDADGLRLRPWRESDAPEVLRGLTDPDYRRWNTPKTPVADLAGALRYLASRAEGWRNGGIASFAVTEDGRVLGTVVLNPVDWWMSSARVSYWTLPEARGRRVASRALASITRWALDDLGLHRLELGHAVGHEASCAIARRCGYDAEGTLRGAMRDPAGGFRAMHLHARVTEPSPG